MYKILKPLNGYGYLVGDITSQIKPVDVERFLKHKLIEEVIPEKKKESTKGSK
jgi:hypothetical protein